LAAGLPANVSVNLSRNKGISPMLKYYIKTTEAFKRLRTDNDGVVSFEYIIVAACIIGAVAAAFGTGANGAIGTALAGGITKITTAFTAAV
jgi:pilus assembly protein Flp/PilA